MRVIENDNPYGVNSSDKTVARPTPAHTGPESMKHHYMVAGEVMIIEGDSIGSIKLNTIMLTNSQRITVLDIGNAQKSLQAQFFARRKISQETSEVEIADVFIHGISYLGHMKPSTFTNLPKEA
jgi:hypothetical protein